MSSSPGTADRIGNVLISEERIQARVAELGRELSEAYTDQAPILVNVLKGGFIVPLGCGETGGAR